jgi:hypothetical protein
MAGSYNIVAEQGATFRFNFRVETGGTPWNLTDYTARMQVRQSTASTNALLDLTTENGTIVIEPVGHVSITVAATPMANVPSGRWVYDLELVSSGGEVTRLLEGRFIVSPEVTV